MKAYGDSRAIAPLILNLGTNWKWDVIVTRVVGPQVWSERYGEKKVSCLCRESNLHFWVVQPVAQSVYRLRYPGSRVSEGNYEKA
jgi:hypothetical protein